MPDMNPEFPNPTGMGGGPPNLGVPGSPQVTQQDQQPQQPDPQQLSASHDTLFGKAAKMLLGNDNQYSVDQNGQMVNNPVQQKPGQLFKNILAAAILGGAAGANGDSAQGFAGGAVRGGAAAVGNAERLDAIKKQQAETDFKDRMVVDKGQREQQELQSQDSLRKAQIAQANAVTLHTNMITQGMSLTQHEEVGKIGRQHFADYQAAGIEPVFKDIPESEMRDVMANRPGAGTLDWEPTGTKIMPGKDGQPPSFEQTYSAVDPKGTIKLSQANIDQWKKDGMDKFHPELFNVLKAGKELTTQQFIELKRKDGQLYNDNLHREKDEQNSAESVAKVKHLNAEAASALASAAHSRAAAGQIADEKTKTQAMGKAFEELNKMDGDFDKLSPKSKIIIGESQAALIPAMNAEVKQILAEDATDSGGKAKQIMNQIDDIRNLSMQAIKHGAAVPAEESVQMTNPQGQLVSVPKSKVEAAAKNGYKPQGLPETHTPLSVQEIGQQRRGAVKDFVKGVGNVISNSPLNPVQ